jgi:hypothetical protein
MEKQEKNAQNTKKRAADPARAQAAQERYWLRKALDDLNIANPAPELLQEIEARAKELKREYKKQWARNNPERVRAIQERYWQKKAMERINIKEIPNAKVARGISFMAADLKREYSRKTSKKSRMKKSINGQILGRANG